MVPNPLFLGGSVFTVRCPLAAQASGTGCSGGQPGVCVLEVSRAGSGEISDMGMWQRVWGLCLAHRDYLVCPWLGHPPAMPGPCNQRGPQSLLKHHHLLGSFHDSLCYTLCIDRPLPLSDLGFLVKCNFFMEAFQTLKPGQPLPRPQPLPLFILRVPQHPGMVHHPEFFCNSPASACLHHSTCAPWKP